MHLVPPGSYGFDFGAMRPVAGGAMVGAPSISGRRYPALTLPAVRAVCSCPGASRTTRRATWGSASWLLPGAPRPGSSSWPRARQEHGRPGGREGDRGGAPARCDGQGAVVRAGRQDRRRRGGRGRRVLTGTFLTAPDRSIVAGALAAQPVATQAVKARWQAGKVLPPTMRPRPPWGPATSQTRSRRMSRSLPRGTCSPAG